MRHAKIRERLRRDPESGQATTEFALILIPLLIVVAGIIYFGIGLNYWLDMNRVANQGARWASVDNWPAVCPRDTATPPTPGYNCTNSSSATPCAQVMTAGNHSTLQDVLRCSARNNPTVTLCYPGKTAASATVGDPVQVKLTCAVQVLLREQRPHHAHREGDDAARAGAEGAIRRRGPSCT